MKRLSVAAAAALLSACASAQVDPSQAKAFVEEGRAAAGQGDHAGAVVFYSKAIEADPQFSEGWYSRGYSNVQLRLSPSAPSMPTGPASGEYSRV